MGAFSVLAHSAISASLLLYLFLSLARHRRCGPEKPCRRNPDAACNGDKAQAHLQQISSSYPQPGASIMEQIVPEIIQHMLSYLDYRSLCNVSMTNSLMRRVANDDSIWKALFHKDFTVEQSCVLAPYGWKSHYAVTKAVVEVNRSFYKYFQMKSVKGMNRLWLNSDYIKCIHPNGELLCGYDAIMQQWHSIFSMNQRFEFELQDERVRVFGNMAWITVKEFINSSAEPFLTTNVFEHHNGHWFMVHHHSSLLLEGYDCNTAFTPAFRHLAYEALKQQPYMMWQSHSLGGLKITRKDLYALHQLIEFDFVSNKEILSVFGDSNV